MTDFGPFWVLAVLARKWPFLGARGFSPRTAKSRNFCRPHVVSKSRFLSPTAISDVSVARDLNSSITKIKKSAIPMSSKKYIFAVISASTFYPPVSYIFLMFFVLPLLTRNRPKTEISVVPMPKSGWCCPVLHQTEQDQGQQALPRVHSLHEGKGCFLLDAIYGDPLLG